MNNVDYHGAVECEVCNSVYSFENLPEYCSNCGAEMEVSAKPEEVQLAGYERDDFYTQPNEALYHGDFVKRGSAKSMSDHVKGSVTCSWCGTYFAEREDRVNCDSCAGNLPMPPGNDPGPKPPGLPRILPSGYKTKLYITKNISGMNSLFLIVLGLVVPIFILLSLIGLFILVLEIKDKRNRVNCVVRV